MLDKNRLKYSFRSPKCWSLHLKAIRPANNKKVSESEVSFSSKLTLKDIGRRTLSYFIFGCSTGRGSKTPNEIMIADYALEIERYTILMNENKLV